MSCPAVSIDAKPDLRRIAIPDRLKRDRKFYRWPTSTFVIAGGGFSGIMSAHFLADLTSKAVQAKRLPHATIILVDPSPVLPSGRIFGAASVPEGYPHTAFQMNRVAARLSPFPHDAHHFGHWFQQRTGLNPNSTVPTRFIYGEYLRELFDRLVTPSPLEVNVSILRGTVEGVSRCGEGNELHVMVTEQIQGSNREADELLSGHQVSSFIDATGHKNRFLASTNVEGFYPYVEAFLLARHEYREKDLTVVGFGASTVDLFRAIGFERLSEFRSITIISPHDFDISVPKPNSQVAEGKIRLDYAALRQASLRGERETSYGGKALAAQRNELVVILNEEEYGCLKRLKERGTIRWLIGQVVEDSIHAHQEKVALSIMQNTSLVDHLSHYCVWCPRWQGGAFMKVGDGYCPTTSLHTSMMFNDLANFDGYNLTSYSDTPVAIVGPQALDNFFWGVRRIGRETHREMARLVELEIANRA